MVRAARLCLVMLAVPMTAAVASCGPVDAGSASADDFREWMSGTAHVERLDLSSNNDLPWTGTLWADVVVEPGATVAQIADVAQRATSFESRASTTFTIGYTRDDFAATFAVFPDQAAANLAMIELAGDVDQSTAATEFIAAEAAGRDEAGVTVTGPDDFLMAFDQLSAMIASSDAPAGDMLTVQDEAKTFTVSAHRGTGAAGPRAAYEAVRAQFPVTTARLTDTTLEVRVDAPETPAVVALARRAAPEVTTTAQFGTVTKTAAGDYAAADALLAQVTAAGPVLSAVLAPDSARVTVADLATVLAVYAAVGDGPQYGGVYLTLSTADARFTVSSAGGPLAPYLPVLNELSAPRWADLLTAASIDGNGLGVETADLDRAQARDLGTVLSLSPTETPIEVRPGSATGFALVRADLLTAASLDPFGDPSAPDSTLLAAFVEGWNSPR